MNKNEKELKKELKNTLEINLKQISDDLTKAKMEAKLAKKRARKNFLNAKSNWDKDVEFLEKIDDNEANIASTISNDESESVKIISELKDVDEKETQKNENIIKDSDKEKIDALPSEIENDDSNLDPTITMANTEEVKIDNHFDMTNTDYEVQPFAGKLLTLLSSKKYQKFLLKRAQTKLTFAKLKLSQQLKDDILLFEKLKNERKICKLIDFANYASWVTNYNLNEENLKHHFVSLMFHLLNGKAWAFENGSFHAMKIKKYKLIVYETFDYYEPKKNNLISLPNTNFFQELVKLLSAKLEQGTMVLLTDHVAILKVDGKLKAINSLAGLR